MSIRECQKPVLKFWERVDDEAYMKEQNVSISNILM